MTRNIKSFWKNSNRKSQSKVKSLISAGFSHYDKQVVELADRVEIVDIMARWNRDGRFLVVSVFSDGSSVRGLAIL